MARRRTPRRQGWSYSAGECGKNRVRAYERPEWGYILLEYYEKTADRRSVRRRVSLGRVTQEAAKAKADAIAARLRVATSFASAEPVTVRTLFDMYEREVTPTKAGGTQLHDRQVTALARQCFGTARAVPSLSRLDWDKFIRDRRSGTLRPAGRVLAAVRDRQVQYDLKTVLAAFNWACTVKDVYGRPLLDRNPFQGLAVPREESPHRPELTNEEYIALQTAGQHIHRQFKLALVLVHETGHRIGSVRKLRWSDIDLKAGTVRWRAENDKIGFEHTTVLTEVARSTLETERARQACIGDAWVFPAPRQSSHPTSRYTLRHWWDAAEVVAKLEPTPRRGWHSLRRQFASEMKHAPLKDLTYLGGWKSAATVVDVYQRPDTATMRQAFADRRPVGAALTSQIDTKIDTNGTPEHDAPSTSRIANEA